MTRRTPLDAPLRPFPALLVVLFPLLVSGAGCEWLFAGPPDAVTPDPRRSSADPGVSRPDPSLVAVAEAAIEPLAEEQAALDLVNRVRADLGLRVLTVGEAVSDAAQNHADYLWLNMPLAHSPHAEDPALPGYTGTAPDARLAAAGVDLAAATPLGEVIAWQPRSVAGVAVWLETVYHRLPLLRPEATAIGYGHVLADGLAINVMEIVTPAERAAAPTQLVRYPGPGATGVALSWDGAESPAPPAPPGGFDSGPVVTLSAALGVSLRLHEVTLSGPAGESLPLVVLVARDDDVAPAAYHRDLASAIAFYAHEPLRPELRYDVRLVVSVNGAAPQVEAWSFTTGPAPDACTPGGDDCGLGRSCYAADQLRQCRFGGVLPERAPCTGLADCAPGLACAYDARLADLGAASQVCVPYCTGGTSLPGLPSCETGCEYGWAALASPVGSGLPAIGVCFALPR